MRAKLAAALEEASKLDEQTRLATLRLINAAIRDRLASRNAPNGEDVETPAETSWDADVMQLLGTMIAQREDSARAYEESGRLELAERERAEIAVIREFMPRPLDEAETKRAINEVMRALGADGIRDISKVMAALKSQYAGRMNFGKAGVMVRESLCKKAKIDAE
ncbi:MAG: GatB/YqeY domain-containing protein [Neomegalonema sp.]|nr:GatB/YqeY domain-containing protein [Neomegalonema sp.]